MATVKTLPLGAYQTNCYLVWGEDSGDCVVIDPGYQSEVILSQAKAQGKNIRAILLTHGHFDHVGAVRQLASDTDCDVYLHPAELSLPEAFTAGPLYYTHTYGEGDTLSLAGLSLRVLHTPGHTPGSVCLEVEDLLFSGDTLFRDSCGRTDLPGGDWATIHASLRRLAALEGNPAVYPGHGEATTLAIERENNPYIY